MATPSRKIDQNALKSGQALTIGLLLFAFIIDSWLLVAFVAISQLAGAAALPVAPFRLIHQLILKPGGLVRPRILSDNPEPHRFAMLVGAVFNGTATLALVSGTAVLGWTLVWIVIILANLNFWLNFCLGCWVYYQLNRLGVPGFSAAPIQD